jgi:hypothetical protein
VQQAITPDRVLGRVNATMRFLGGGVLPVCALIGGALGKPLAFPGCGGSQATAWKLALDFRWEVTV